jgi:hypothetical protein
MSHQNPLGTKELTFCNRFCQVTLAPELAMKSCFTAMKTTNIHAELTLFAHSRHTADSHSTMLQQWNLNLSIPLLNAPKNKGTMHHIWGLI